MNPIFADLKENSTLIFFWNDGIYSTLIGPSGGVLNEEGILVTSMLPEDEELEYSYAYDSINKRYLVIWELYQKNID